MKHFIASLFLILLSLFAKAQLPGNFNLIPNPSFEFNLDEDVYDTSFSSSKTCWVAANGVGFGVSRVPKYDVRFAAAHSGLAYAAISCYSGSWKLSANKVFDSTIDIRCYLQTKLLKPLVAGSKYYFSFYLGQTKTSGKFSAHLPSVNIPNTGVYFSREKVSDYTNIRRINVIPQINFKFWTLAKFDTFEYVKLTAVYTATGDEQYLTIGNFDYFEDFVLYNYDKGYIRTADTLLEGASISYIDDLSLVSDTTLPLISLTQFSLGKDTSLACAGDSIRLGGEDNFFHYWWNTGDTTRFISAKKPGTYWCKVDFGCSTFTDSIQIVATPFTFSLGADTNMSCTGVIHKLSAPAGCTYVWSTGESTANIDVYGPGTYWCQANNGCSAFTDTIKIVATPFVFSLGNDTSIYCINDSIKLSISVAGAYTWSTGESSASISVRAPGTYWCRVNDGCTFFTDTIIISPIFSAFSLGKDTLICDKSSFVSTAAVAHRYRWSTGDTTRFINISLPGTYWCRADFGCNTVTDTIVVLGSIAPAPFTINDTALCEAAMPVSVSAPYTASTYLWSNGSTNFTANFATVGKHWLRISNACGDKSYTDTFEIKSLNVSLNNINLGSDTNNCIFNYYLDTITLEVSATVASSIVWSTGSNSLSIRVHQPGAYWVRVSNVCYTVADTINIIGCANRAVDKIGIPNTFTPNGDGKNDVFRILYLPEQVVSFSLKIFNRYGQMIRELKSRGDYWDGGEYELGVYYYIFVYKDVTGKDYLQKGDISLLR